MEDFSDDGSDCGSVCSERSKLDAIALGDVVIEQEQPIENPTKEEIEDSLLAGRNCLLHGPGGSGKSQITKDLLPNLKEKVGKIKSSGHEAYMKDKLGKKGSRGREVYMKVQVLTYVKEQARTFGMGATNIHDFMGFGVPRLVTDPIPSALETSLAAMQGISGNSKVNYYELLDELESNAHTAKKNERAIQLLKNILFTQILIIDEISNVGSKIFTKMDQYLKRFRQDPRPFGGITVMFIGDMLQTAPVKDIYAFATPIWEALKLKVYLFKTIHRFEDKSWAQLLLRLRAGTHTQTDIEYIMSLKSNVNEIGGMKICSTRKEMHEYNYQKVKEIPGKGYSIAAIDSVSDCKNRTFIHIENEVRRNRLIEEYGGEMPIDKDLVLKVGAQVMFLVNKRKEYSNGERGVVVSFTKMEGQPISAIVVKSESGEEYTVVKQVCTKFFLGGDIQIERRQFPIRPAYAATTQKVQGKTENFITLDYGKAFVGAGVAYVGLSRARSPLNIKLIEFNPRCVKQDASALAYVKLLEGWEQTATGEVTYDYEIDNHQEDDMEAMAEGW